MSELRKIIVYLEKGGVGKTMTSIMLASGLAKAGKHVTLIDLDPQDQCRRRLGLMDAPNPKFALADIMKEGWPDDMSDLEKFKSVAMATGRSKLYLIPSGRILSKRQMDLTHMSEWKTVLRKALGFLEDSGMDYVILDTNPAWTPLSAAALYWGDEMIMPVGTSGDDMISFAHFSGMLEEVQEEREESNLGDLDVVYVLPTRFDKRSGEACKMVEKVQQFMPEQACKPIRELTALKECGRANKTIWEHAPKSDAAKDYQLFVDLVMNNDPSEKE